MYCDLIEPDNERRDDASDSENIPYGNRLQAA
jgi:hypothetical protein